MKNFTSQQLIAYKNRFMKRNNLSNEKTDIIVDKYIIKSFDYGNGKYEYVVDTLKCDESIKEQKEKIKELAKEMVESAIDIADDEERNFADIYVGDDFDLDYIDELIEEINKDKRVLEVAGVTFNDVLDIIIKDEYLNLDWESEKQ